MLRILFLPILIYAISFEDIKKDIKSSLLYKMDQEKLLLIKEKLKSIQSKKYGMIQLNYISTKFFDRPYIKILNNNFYTTDNYLYSSEIKYSFSLFDKNLDNLIEKHKLEVIKQELELKNLEKKLLLDSLRLYTQIYSIKQNIKALIIAKNSLENLKNKAKALYENDMLNKSSLDEIDAKYYEVLADIKKLKSIKKSLLNILSNLLNKQILDIDDIIVKKQEFKIDVENRIDVKVIKQNLKIANNNIKLTKSNLYPTIIFQAGYKKEASNYSLTKNNYQNINSSYVSIGLEYNFDLSKKYNLNIAKISRNTELIFYSNYLNNIKTEFYNDIDKLNSLFFQLKASKKEIKARESYLQLVEAKFNQGLSDSTDLNKAIANLAKAKAKKNQIKSDIFYLQQKLILENQ